MSVVGELHRTCGAPREVSRVSGKLQRVGNGPELEVPPQFGVPKRASRNKDGIVEDPHPLRLALMDRHNWRAAMTVQISSDQVRFVAGHQPVALVILAKAYVRPGDLDWEPLALTSGASVVGVVALAHACTHTDLLHMAIDVTKQGQGVGSAAVELVLAHVAETRPGCHEVRLTVHPDNERAQRLYRRVGFLPNGQMLDGEPVWSLNLKRR